MSILGRVSWLEAKMVTCDAMSKLRIIPTHMEVSINGQSFYLVHAWPADNVHDEVWLRPQIDAPNLKPGYRVIIGHTKVLSLIQPEETRIAYAMDLEDGGDHLRILHAPGFIDIDCGCGYDMPIKALACFRLGDMCKTYVFGIEEEMNQRRDVQYHAVDSIGYSSNPLISIK